MDITLPVPQHVHELYVHSLLHSVAIPAIIAACAVGVVVLMFGLATGEGGDAIFGSTLAAAITALVAILIAGMATTSDASTTKTSWHTTGLPAFVVGQANDASKNQALNAALREHYGLVADDPKAAPTTAPLSNVTSAASSGTGYTLEGKPVSCAFAYTVEATNNVEIPTKIQMQRVICTNGNTVQAVAGR